MTTVEREPEPTATVGGTPVTAATAPTTGATAATAAEAPEGVVGMRERFGGAKLGAAFFGWLVAVGMTVLLTGLVALVVAALGRPTATSFLSADAATVGFVGMGAVVVVLAIAYLMGGYVAGRLARFDGTRNGLYAWLVGIVVSVLATAAAAVLSANTGVTPRLPVLPGEVTSLSIGGAVLLAVVVIVTAVTAALGGRLGERFHRRVDRAAGIDRLS